MADDESRSINASVNGVRIVSHQGGAKTKWVVRKRSDGFYFYRVLLGFSFTEEPNIHVSPHSSVIASSSSPYSLA